jgi:lipoprotein signal peptidase
VDQLARQRQRDPEVEMGIGVGLLLIAVGAILTFAVHAYTHIANIQTIGVILMIVGAVGLLVDMVIFAPRRRGVVDDGYGDDVVVTRRRTTV